MATNIIKIRSGECAILPSNAIIVSAMTFATNPSVTSPDCQQLALDVEEAIPAIIDAELRLRDTDFINKNQANLSPNMMEVRIFRARFFDGTKWLQFDVPNVEVDSDENTWKNLLAMTGTVLEGSIKYISREYQEGGSGRGDSVKIKAKMSEYVRDNLVFDVFVSNNQGQFDDVYMSVRFMQY